MPAPIFLKKPLSLRTIATNYFDLNARPKSRAFEVLSYNCENDLEKEKLLEFASFEGQEDLINYVNRPRRTILEVMQDFPHATSKLTVDLLFELFTPIKPRPFSIASSYYHSDRIELLVAIVEYYTKLKAKRKGLCSNWMRTLQKGDRVCISIRKGSFTFPIDKNLETPLVMVGPGTGLAIFRGVLQECKTKRKTNNLVLFFGCRYEKKDFHCADELREMESCGMLKLFCAFSRDRPDDDHKM
jgi:equilibrative nucleoside transporter 1/2/3